MTTDGFGAFVAGEKASTRRGFLEVKRQLGLYLPVAGGTMTGGLILPGTPEVTLTEQNPPLMIGSYDATNLALDVDEIQARNNGAEATLLLNPHGGRVDIGTGSLTGSILRVGNDTELTDANVANRLILRGVQNSDRASLQLGTAGPVIATDSNYIHLDSKTDIYSDGTVHWKRDAAGSANYAAIYSGGIGVYGTRGFLFEDYGGGWFMQDTTWIRANANKNVYTGGEIRVGTKFSHDGAGYVFTHGSDTDTGYYYDSSGLSRMICNGATAMRFHSSGAALAGSVGMHLRLYEYNDSNHYLSYTNLSATAVHPASGIGANGARLGGYQACVITTVSTNRNWLFESGGSAFGPGAWLTFSTRDSKDDISYLRPEDCLAEVALWKPISYRAKPIEGAVEKMEAPLQDGFIAEEMHEVSPTIVSATDGKPSAIAYAQATARLTGAVQALLARVDELEARLAKVEKKDG
jgi:hypothetical protein